MIVIENNNIKGNVYMGKCYTLQVGTKELDFEIPFENIIEGKARCESKSIDDLRYAVRESLNNMVGYVDIGKLNSSSSVVIVSDDYTRPTPTKEILPALLDFLSE